LLVLLRAVCTIIFFLEVKRTSTDDGCGATRRENKQSLRLRQRSLPE